MTRTYRATGFTVFYFIALLSAAGATAFSLCELPRALTFGAIVLIIAVLVGAPFMVARVTIDDRGITQQLLKRKFIPWADILSWKRIAQPGSDGPERFTIKTRNGSFTLNHNCIYGKRLDEVELACRKQVSRPAGT